MPPFGRYDIYNDCDQAYHTREEEPQGRRSRRRDQHQQQRQPNPHTQLRNFIHNEPYYPNSPPIYYDQAPAPVDFGRGGTMMDAFSGSLFNSVHNMMHSMDRMFDDMTARSGGSSTYFYESRTRTVGPDGVVREEVVREQPGVDGRPTTTRHVRNTDQYGRTVERERQRERNRDRINNEDHEQDVVIEELDEYGNVIHNCIDQNTNVNDKQDEEDMQQEEQQRRTGWWQSRMRNVRGNRA